MAPACEFPIAPPSGTSKSPQRQHPGAVPSRHLRADAAQTDGRFQPFSYANAVLSSNNIPHPDRAITHAVGWPSKRRHDSPSFTKTKSSRGLPSRNFAIQGRIANYLAPTSEPRFSLISFNNALCGSANFAVPSSIKVSSIFLMSTFLSMSSRTSFPGSLSMLRA